MNTIAPLWKTRTRNNHWLNDFDNLFEGLLEPQHISKGFKPAYDIEENEKYILLSLDVPGVEEKDLSVNITNNQLIVSGERVSTLK